jgi:acyl dehydratase
MTEARVRTFSSAAELLAASGTELGPSGWHRVTQEMIDAFADATGDHQWIHVDRERAAAGPFGTTVAHGFLTLALIPVLLRDILAVPGARLAVNYGLERVRFPAPLPAGSEIRARVRITAVSAEDGRVRMHSAVTIAARDAAKPCCVAEVVTLFVF